ncbi:MAG: rRNA maturation RNase YbeY [Mycoplasmataceae bacterium]|nr:rRNA maturation RNase YbeY [Mycoplasmataceae bacterium]
MLKFEINDKMNKITKKNISDFKKINTYVNKFLDNKNAYLYEVTIIDSKKIKNLNAIYRGINEQTDVLSFCLLNDNSNNKKLLGEIYIAYDYATKEAKKHHWSIAYELSLLFTHGLLHLFGYDHKNKSEQHIMFELQNKILKKLK